MEPRRQRRSSQLPSPTRDARASRRRAASKRGASRSATGRNARAARGRRRPPQSHPRRVLLTIVAIGLALFVFSRVRSCWRARLAANAAHTDTTVSELHTSPYDWSCLERDDAGWLSYVSDGQLLSRAGVDVSEHQEWIDWQTVADAGIDFAMVRVGYRATGSGTIVQDAYAEYNLDAVPAAGIDLGVYFYSQATTEEEAREEAEFVITLLAGRELDYPIAFDFEQGNQENERVANMTYEERTLVATAFCERIEEEGLTAMVYGNPTSLSEMDVDQVASRGLWYAEYGSAPSTDLRIALWQYSETGAVPGIDGEVDLDLDLTGVWRST